MHGIKSANAAWADGCFGATTNNDICFAEAKQHQGINDGVCRGGAGRNGRVVRATEPVFHRDMTAADVGNHFGDEEGIEARRTLACNETGRLLKKGVNSPNAGTPK